MLERNGLSKGDAMIGIRKGPVNKHANIEINKQYQILQKRSEDSYLKFRMCQYPLKNWTAVIRAEFLA